MPEPAFLQKMAKYGLNYYLGGRLSFAPLFYCNLQIDKISGPPEVARLAFCFAKNG